MTVTVDREEVRTWVGVGVDVVTDEQLQGILDAEIETQALRCRILPNAVQSGLNQAVLRRCGRAVAAMSIPTGIVGDPALGVSRLPGYDAEIERYERPWRKTVAG